jgi:hypothetical protein
MFAKQLRHLGVNVTCVGWFTMVITTVLRLAGSALYGFYAVADFHSGREPDREEVCRQNRGRLQVDT